jgi:hypothetical protein
MTQRAPHRDPVRDAIDNAPLDDVPMTDAERRDVAAARKRGRYVTTEALRARLARRAKRR